MSRPDESRLVIPPPPPLVTADYGIAPFGGYPRMTAAASGPDASTHYAAIPIDGSRRAERCRLQG